MPPRTIARLCERRSAYRVAVPETRIYLDDLQTTAYRVQRDRAARTGCTRADSDDHAGRALNSERRRKCRHLLNYVSKNHFQSRNSSR